MAKCPSTDDTRTTKETSPVYFHVLPAYVKATSLLSSIGGAQFPHNACMAGKHTPCIWKRCLRMREHCHITVSVSYKLSLPLHPPPPLSLSLLSLLYPPLSSLSLISINLIIIEYIWYKYVCIIYVNETEEIRSIPMVEPLNKIPM